MVSPKKNEDPETLQRRVVKMKKVARKIPKHGESKTTSPLLILFEMGLSANELSCPFRGVPDNTSYTILHTLCKTGSPDNQLIIDNHVVLALQ
jgi:hypothetical protein